MSIERTPIPSPLAGEGERSERPGEGRPSPSPASLTLRIRSAPSPARGEGSNARNSTPKARLVKRARALRVRMSDAERKLWFALRDRRFAQSKFRRQVPIGPFIADFVCFEARLVIEVDGGQHAGSLADKRRDHWFAANNFRLLRFWNNDVLSNLDVVTLVVESLSQEERR